jgi:hypothetical protein
MQEAPKKDEKASKEDERDRVRELEVHYCTHLLNNILIIGKLHPTIHHHNAANIFQPRIHAMRF